MKLDKAFEAYSSWVRKSKSPLTARVYTLDVKRFVQYLGETQDSNDITPLDISGFQDTLEQKGWSARSVNRVAYALISFLETLGRTDIAHLVPTPVYEAKLPQWLPETEIQKIIASSKRSLDRAVLTIAYELAMRRGEVPLLNRDWYDEKNSTLKVHRLKHRGTTPPDYVLPLREWAISELDQYLYYRRDSNPALFISTHMKRIHKDTILDLYRRVTKGKVNMPFHCFTKHSRLTNYAVWMIDKFGQTDITRLAKFAGHKNPASTLIYTHLASNYLLQK